MAVVELPSVTMRIRAGCEGGGKGALLQTEKSGTLATGNDQYLFCNKNRQRPAYGFDLTQITSKTNRSTLQEVQPSLCAAGNPHVVHPKIVGTLCASAAGLSRPAGMASEPDLSVAHATFSRQRSDMFRESDIASTQTARQCKEATDLCVYCLQGNMIGRSDENGPRGSGVQTRLSYTLTATDTPAVAAVDCRNLRELDEISGTLQAKKTAGYSLNYQNPIRTGYIVRRLTPTECEKLMGFDVGWTAYGHDGKEISDSRRYSMLGNSIATPCAAYIIQGILEQYAKEGS
jgi:DNA (cytosine-5)-methyltransferase 1